MTTEQRIVSAQPLTVSLGERRYTFNAWNTANSITWERKAWHQWVAKFVGTGEVLTDRDWWWYYRAFLHWRDGCDLRDTQADSLI